MGFAGLLLTELLLTSQMAVLPEPGGVVSWVNFDYT